MKKILTLITLIQITSSAVAQLTSYVDFKVSEQEIIYQRVFILDSVSINKLEEFYKKQPYVANLETNADGILFDLNTINVDYKKFQFSQVNTPIIIQTGKFSGKVSVGVKDGKYRVTIKSIQFTGNIGYKMITEKDNLTRYATKNSGTILAEDWCRPTMLGLIDKAFTDKLEFKQVDGEW